MSSQAHPDDTAVRIGGAVLVAALVGGLCLGLIALVDLAVGLGNTALSILEVVVAVLAVLAGARQLRRPNHRVLDGDPDSQSSSSDATR